MKWHFWRSAVRSFSLPGWLRVSGCWAWHTAVLWQVWAVPGVCLGVIPCWIHLSVLSACASLPANTPEFPCNNILDLGGLHLDSILEFTEAARIAGSRSSWSFHCTSHVEIWWWQSSLSLSAGRSYGMKGEKKLSSWIFHCQAEMLVMDSGVHGCVWMPLDDFVFFFPAS